MKKSVKKVVSCVLCVLMICTMAFSFSVSAASKVTINLFGENIEIPEGYGVPFIDASTNRTLVPARGVFEAMGAEVLWDAPTRCVTVKKDTDEIKLTIDSVNATKNGEARTLDQPAVLIGGRTFIPLRFIAESLNLEVGFDGATTTVIIKEKAPEKKVFEAGKYAVGSDIKAAEYLLVSSGEGEIKLLRGENSADSANVISTLTFKNSIYVNIIGADYIETKNCTVYSLDSIPARGTNGVYKNGMFKAGLDFEAGNYTVSKVISSENASYKVFASAYSTEGANTAISGGMITKNTTISLKDNQYITLENAQLTKGTATGVISGGGSGGSGSSRPSGGGGTSTPTPDIPQPSETPTEEPTVESTEVPPQEELETPDEPEISQNSYYEDFEGEVLDFGYFFSIPLLSKGTGEADELGNVTTYTYDISLFYESGEFDRELFMTYIGEIKTVCGFGEEYFLGQPKSTCHLFNTATGLKVDIIESDGNIVVYILRGEPDPELDDMIHS